MSIKGKISEGEILKNSIKSCLRFINDQLEIIKNKLPYSLSDEQRKITFQEQKKKFYEYREEKKISERIAIENLAKVEATLYTIEYRLEEDDGSSAICPNNKALSLSTIGEWFDLMNEMLENSLKQIQKNKKQIKTLNIEDYGEMRAIELLQSVDYHCYLSSKEILEVSKNTYLIL
jgi:hypothetical protein